MNAHDIWIGWFIMTVVLCGSYALLAILAHIGRKRQERLDKVPWEGPFAFPKISAGSPWVICHSFPNIMIEIFNKILLCTSFWLTAKVAHLFFWSHCLLLLGSFSPRLTTEDLPVHYPAPREGLGLDFNQLDLDKLPSAFHFEYKTWERIHRGIADPRLLAIPTSWGRVSAPNLNWGDFSYDWLSLTASQRVVVAIVLCV